PLDDVQRQRMRAEEKERPVSDGGWEPLQSFAHCSAHRGNEASMDWPAIDQAPLKAAAESRSVERAPQLVEARPRGAAGDLGILTEGDSVLPSVCRHCTKRVITRRLDIAEGHVEAVRRRPRRKPVEPRHHPLTLCGGVPENG